MRPRAHLARPLLIPDEKCHDERRMGMYRLKYVALEVTRCVARRVKLDAAHFVAHVDDAMALPVRVLRDFGPD